MNIHTQIEGEAMPSMEEELVCSTVFALRKAVRDLIELRHRRETADLVLLEQDSIHADCVKLSNLDADIWTATNNGRQ